MSKTKTPVSAACLALKSIASLAVEEASALAPLPGGRFLVADDERGVLVATANGAARVARSAKVAKALQNLEGLAVSPGGTVAYALSESGGRISQMRLTGKGATIKVGPVKHLGSLPKIDQVKNKGWEGLSVLPRQFTSNGVECLVAVHEAQPKRVGLFRLPSLEVDAMLKLPRKAKDLLSDLADVAICPQTGHFFILSDESRCIAELAREGERLALLGSFDLPLRKREKPEGLAFDGPETLWVVTDGSARLLCLTVTR
jgi:uncharacterized protein YjiK